MRLRCGKVVTYNSVNPPRRRRGMVSEAPVTVAEGSKKKVCLDSKQQEEEARVARNCMEDPWKNDVILDKVFEYCTTNTLRDCRLVSKKWYQASIHDVRRRNNSPAIKLECKGKRRGGDRDIINSRTYVSEFVQDFHSGGSQARMSQDINGVRQHNKFDLRFDKTFKRADTRMSEFWNGAGPWITSLKVLYTGSPHAVFFKQIFLSGYLPKLEELDIHVQSDTVDLCLSSDDEDNMPPQQPLKVHFLDEGNDTVLKSLKISGDLCSFLFDWKIYLCSCPKLEKLDLSGCFLQHEYELEGILAAIKGIRTGDKKKLSLKSLSFYEIGTGAYTRMFSFSPAVPVLLKESQLDLESLSVYFSRDVPYERVHEMCTIHAKTLKKLSFYHYAPLQASPFLGVSMNHLDSLIVEGNSFKNLLFLKELPKLRTLKLVLCRSQRDWSDLDRDHGGYMNTIISATDSKGMGKVTLTSLSSFSCDYAGDFDFTDLSRLRDWMPNLVALELVLDSETFPTVCGLWPNLTHVCIFGGRIGDRGIAGLETRNGEITFNQPNITNLKDLQSFVVKSHGWNRTQEGDRDLTTYSIQFGLSKLRRLKTVSIAIKQLFMNLQAFKKCFKKEMPLAELNILYR